jgi:Carboxypeptidase regulatory-like domain
VQYGEVQAVFEKYACTACHPGVNPSLDLTEANSYEQLVGIRALEDPTLYRVVAGDPERSFLYLKVGGAAPVADIPAIGTRMPPRAPPIDPEDMELIRRWILQGAKGPDGRTGGPQVPTPGTPPGDLDVAEATETEGSATIVGSVVDQRYEPIEGALVTMLLSGGAQEGGEEHYRVAVTDAQGRFTLPDAPTGQYLLKAYGPETIYVSRIVALEDDERQEVRFGLPDRVAENPAISSPSVSGTSLSMTVEGNDLDGNYTLAVNPRAGLVFELHNAGNAPGTWSATIERELGGPWIFMAVDETCNVSEFLTVER